MGTTFPSSFILRQARILDDAGSFSDAEDLHVVEGRVARRGHGLTAGRDDVSFDFSGLFLSPGFFDCHTHVAMSSTNPLELLRTPLTRWTLDAAQNLSRTLDAGVTFVRDAGGADAGIRSAVADGVAPGPHLQISVVLISQTGGHADGFLPGPGLAATAGYLIPDYPGRPIHTADGPEQMRQAVREVLRAGGDWIKLCTTGGFNSPHDDPEAPELSLGEVSMAVHEAARKGRSVMVHAFGGAGIDIALKAGVRSIEHGTFLTEEQAVRMAADGVWLVPTLAIHEDVLRWNADGILPAYFARKANRLEESFSRGVQIARAHNVRVATGSDFFSSEQHGQNLRELALLRAAGFSIEETMIAATAESAALCGVANLRGRLVEGQAFDAVVLDEDPSPVDFFASQGRVAGVFKDGFPVRAHPALAG